MATVPTQESQKSMECDRLWSVICMECDSFDCTLYTKLAATLPALVRTKAELGDREYDSRAMLGAFS